MLEEDFDNDIDDGNNVHHHHHQHSQTHNLSRLSVCTSSTTYDVDDDEENVNNVMAMFVSGLSIESFDADGEFSEDHGKETHAGCSSGSETEFGSFYSLPFPGVPIHTPIATKDYEVDVDEEKTKKRRMRRRRKGSKSKNKDKEEDDVVHDQRVKGRSRSLCMDMEEVKACTDLGFGFQIPTRLSFPGDDPREVKARLKMWAHAVAVSASKYSTSF
ncbi:uncharacterized protein LOC130950639 [Arachis stenosperma]|uniref:uncharacterized protein LOC130950639 n=1 Tax=Arachis stenosperma TaxID=217475 RepID=UPI0025AC5264|nr:uncharacterized protein LOC130950639 [Arachis stenosperma]